MADFSDLTVLDPAGETHSLGELAKGRPTILVFLRHFGWLFCREAAARFAPKIKAVRKRGAELLFIGNGTPEHAQWFVEALGLGPLPVYTDPRRATYKAAGLKKGILRVVGPKVLLGGARALIGGHRQTSTKGDPWQNGGVVLLDEKGRVRWTHVEENAGEIADPADVLAALDAL